MLMPNRLYPHLSYEIITDVAQVIDNHLRNDWVIRIEYTEEVEYLNTSWHQWGEAFFNITDISAVIDCIRSCHMNNQLCAIRLHAEKFHPRSIFYFCVCQ
ncbi:ribulose bisphosphate carboxylase small subunit [Sulfuriflexus mobilis]|uniref:ribulose bisphosphate carboxylase small subunit n=1 Tax=Sulfuriflexus mobilis TaxID=1811807 RepID=UPI000F81698B|nr:ribulose bisphosphate carboxylase small subunit [Sulfuriflexus mobilis]